MYGKRKAEPRRDISKLKRVNGPDKHEQYTRTEYLFSVTGDEFVARRNYLIEFHMIKDYEGYRYHRTPKGEWDDLPRKKGEYIYERRSEVSNKYLCIGGPLNGKRVSLEDGRKEYQDFNTRDSEYSRGRSGGHFKVIQIHKSLLKG